MQHPSPESSLSWEPISAARRMVGCIGPSLTPSAIVSGKCPVCVSGKCPVCEWTADVYLPEKKHLQVLGFDSPTDELSASLMLASLCPVCQESEELDRSYTLSWRRRCQKLLGTIVPFASLKAHREFLHKSISRMALHGSSGQQIRTSYLSKVRECSGVGSMSQYARSCSTGCGGDSWLTGDLAYSPSRHWVTMPPGSPINGLVKPQSPPQSSR
jgi:hypothetical protein